MFRKLIKNKFPKDAHDSFRKHRNALNRIIKQLKINYYQSRVNDNKNDSAKLWKIIRELANISKNKINKSVYVENCNNADEAAEKFNQHFITIGKNLAEKIIPPSLEEKRQFYHNNIASQHCTAHSFYMSPATPSEVFELIKSLVVRKGIRTNDINTNCIKLANCVLAPIISNIFNLAIISGEFPDELKIAEVKAIYKKGDPLDCSNYRPISLLSQFAKIFEKLIHVRLYNYLKKYNLLSPHQFGFQQNSSTSHAICDIYENLLNNADNGMYSCCVFLDLSKAFDTIDHNLLLKK